MLFAKKYELKTLSLRHAWLAFFLLWATGVFGQVYIDSTEASFHIDSIIPSQHVMEVEEEETPDSFESLVPTVDTGVLHARQLPDSFLGRMRSSEDFWYANHSFAEQKQVEKDAPRNPPATPFFGKPWVRTLIWVLIIGGFVGLMVWYFVSSNIRVFERRNPPLPDQPEDALLSDNIYGIDFQNQIYQAIQRKDFRFAIRMMFLSTLRELADRNLIQYDEKRTNLDYLMQIQKTDYYKDFFQLTRNYEYTWYGKMDPGEDGFSWIKSSFEQFKKRLY